MPAVGERLLSSAALELQAAAVAGDVLPALRARGTRPIVLKGPAIAQWLYAAAEPRPYGDLDLYVDPALFSDGEAALRDLGFEPLLTDEATPGWSMRSTAWRRARGEAVDLHRGIFGICADRSVAWATLSAEAEPLDLDGVEAEALSPPARALHLALHVAQHGTEPKPREDLRRGIVQLARETWVEAFDLAASLDATEAFSYGLYQLPSGRQLAERLGVPRLSSLEAELHGGQPARGARAVAEIVAQPNTKRRLVLLVRYIAPSPDYMRSWSALARRSRPGLAVAYAWRPLWALIRIGPATISYVHARRRAGNHLRSGRSR